MRRILFLLFLSLILGGRSKAQQDPVLDLQQTMPSEDSWWQFFGDSTLIRLIDKSVANNYNLQNAVKNIQLAKSRWRSQQGHFSRVSALRPNIHRKKAVWASTMPIITTTSGRPV